jgi:hypothetical protein
MYILAGMLLIGLIANLLIKPVDKKHFMSEAELAHERQLAQERAAATEVGLSDRAYYTDKPIWLWLAWGAVVIPLAWGVYRTALSAGKLFH